MANRNLPIEAYPSEYMTFLKTAALNPIDVPMPYNLAISTRAAIYKMRAKMRETGHPDYKIVSKVVLKVDKTGERDDEGRELAILRGGSHDEVIAAFNAVGITGEDTLKDDILGELGYGRDS